MAGGKIHLVINNILAYARLRAIESRRSIARSANTGISCLIDQRGDVLNATSWWEKSVLNVSVNINNINTFYTANGDIIGRISAFLGLLLLLWGGVSRIKQKGSF